MHYFLVDVNNDNNQDKDNVQNYSPVIPVLYQVCYDDKDPEGQSDRKNNQFASDLLESSLQGK